MAQELFINAASTTVAASKTAVSSGTTQTWTVASSSLFTDWAGVTASTGLAQFRVVDPADTQVPPEIVLVTNVSGTTWSVTRGVEGTTPTAHSAGFTVQAIATSQGLEAPNLPTVAGAITSNVSAGGGAATTWLTTGTLSPGVWRLETSVTLSSGNGDMTVTVASGSATFSGPQSATVLGTPGSAGFCTLITVTASATLNLVFYANVSATIRALTPYNSYSGASGYTAVRVT